jgi:hypothetical protein
MRKLMFVRTRGFESHSRRYSLGFLHNPYRYRVSNFRPEKEVKAGIVAANNHYAGFGAATANMFRVMRGLPSVEWGMQKELQHTPEFQRSEGLTSNPKTRQKTLLDYPSN